MASLDSTEELADKFANAINELGSVAGSTDELDAEKILVIEGAVDTIGAVLQKPDVTMSNREEALSIVRKASDCIRARDAKELRRQLIDLFSLLGFGPP